MYAQGGSILAQEKRWNREYSIHSRRVLAYYQANGVRKSGGVASCIFLAAAVVRGWGRKETENLSNSPQYHAFHNVHSHAPLAFEEMTQFLQPPEDDSESYCSERGNHPEVRVRWTEHALFCSSHNRRTRVYEVSLPNFQWITNVPWKHLAAQQHCQIIEKLTSADVALGFQQVCSE